MQQSRDEELAALGGAQMAPGHLEYAPVEPEEFEAVARSMRETPLTALYGDGDVAQFEGLFRDFFETPHAVAVSSGTSALHAAMEALGVGPGDEVITPAYSFVASASVIAQQGAVPVFCDIDPDSLNMDVAQCERLIGPRTKAVIVVHIFGKPADVVAIRRLCDERGVALVEDCASAPGARVGKRYVGTFGEVGCFSFNIHKIIRTGEGGMAITGREDLAQSLREVRVNGLSPDGGVNNVVRLGFNYTLPQPIAAMGCVQVRRLRDSLARREAVRQALRATGADVGLGLLHDAPGTTTVGYWSPYLLPDELVGLRSRLIKALRAEGVFAHAGYGEPLYRIEYLSEFGAGREFPATEDVAPRVLCVDPSPWLSETQVGEVVAAIRKVFGRLGDVETLPE